MQNFISAVEWLEKYLVNYPKDKIEQAKKIEAEQQQKMVDDALTNYELGWADRKASSQIEISDEEIEKGADKYFEEHTDDMGYDGFKEGAKWYREQLRKGSANSQNNIQ